MTYPSVTHSRPPRNRKNSSYPTLWRASLVVPVWLFGYSRIRAGACSNTNDPMNSLDAAASFLALGQPRNKDQNSGAPLGIQRPCCGGGRQGSSRNKMAVRQYGVNVKQSEFYR